MQIKELSPSEVEKAARLFIDVFAADPWCEEWLEADAQRRIAELMATPAAIALAASADNHILGFAIGAVEQQSKGRCLIIREFCVSSAERRKGLGKRLLTAIEEHCRDQGIELIGLSTQKGAPAFMFYEDQGYSGVDGEIYMTKRLRGS